MLSLPKKLGLLFAVFLLHHYDLSTGTTSVSSSLGAIAIGAVVRTEVLVLIAVASRANGHAGTANSTDQESITRWTGTSETAEETALTPSQVTGVVSGTIIEPTETAPSLSPTATPDPPASSASSTQVSSGVIALLSTLLSLALSILAVWQGRQAIQYLRREHRKRMEILEVERRAAERMSTHHTGGVENIIEAISLEEREVWGVAEVDSIV
ncbi:hypothetical protein FRB96_006493 [Tulasnella sp. 330]|nr:hypothetical protein FRB96_006493 [Tulasnella sp. 330]KAG8878761.1 hypothetical protein FRB97_002302 [Tulasnella sp. 331]KAG8884834.1 hypothetical protein FRB98_002124 [Tulasnella sp. 332]